MAKQKTTVESIGRKEENDKSKQNRQQIEQMKKRAAEDRKKAEAARKKSGTAAKPAAGTAAPAAAAPAPEAKSEPVTLDTKPATLTTPLKAQDAYGPKHAAYFRKLVMELRNATFIPAELAKGTYYATVRLETDASGKILNYSILQSSGSELLDRYVRQGIRRAGKVSPPPAAVGRFVNVTLTLVR